MDDDDDAHLTSNMSHGASGGWHASNDDPERSGSSARRKSEKYSTSSPLKRTGTTLKAMSNNLRRASLRVVNLAGFGLDEHVRLADADDELDAKEDEDEDAKEDEVLPDLTKALPLRGRTLGYFSSTSRVRVAMYRFLVYR